jgi:LCP family protein required for cell wall assembly
MTSPTSPQRGERSPAIAAALSFFIPGAGQAYAGARRAALIYAIPVIVIALAVAVRLSKGLEHVAIDLLAPEFAMTILVLVVVTGLWRIAALVDAARVAGRGRPSGTRERAWVAVLVALVLVTHAAATAEAFNFYSAGKDIFVGPSATPRPIAVASEGPGDTPAPGTSDDPAGGLETPGPGDTPQPSQSAPPSDRINVLLLGIDSGPGRAHALTDTILVLSVDPVSRTAAMVSIPRDIARFRLPNGLTYTGKINSLVNYVRKNPGKFQGDEYTTLANTVGSMLGINVPYYAAVNLSGFTTMIDAVGGVDVVNEQDINDPGYGGWTDHRPIGFHLSAGKHHLDGQMALAYVRSRKGVGDNDFTRARRQQQLLVALRDKLTDPGNLGKLSDLLDAAKKTLRTNYPPDGLDDLLTLAQSIPGKSVTKVVLGPPYAVNPPASVSGGTYELVLVPDKVKAVSIRLFGAASAYYK